MKTWVMIGIFDQPDVCQIYQDQSGHAPVFYGCAQANQFIRDHRLGVKASPVEISEIELPDRNQG